MKDNLVNEVREQNDIVEVISSYIPLSLKGKNYFGLCPFHQDTNPSMSVSKDLQIYKCFSCGASGNVYNFVMDYEKISFKEALHKLASNVGITLSNSYSKDTNYKNKNMYDIHDLARKYYQNNLNTTAGVKAKNYLLSRKIDEELIKHFEIGLSLNSKDELTKLLLNKDEDIVLLNNIGLTNNEYDVFINRIMFPLHDINGKTIGFSGRIYNDEDTNKYLNTKETPIFKKGELLYNYHNAKDVTRTTNNLIIVEGFMDVIRLYTIGVKNVVALMGTSITKEQISLIKRLSKNIVLSLDGDSAGINATRTIGDLLIKEDMDVKVISFKDNLDPDTYVLKYKEDYLNLLKYAENFNDYKIRLLKQDLNPKSQEEVSEYINSVILELSKSNDEIYKELIVTNLSKEFDISKDLLTNKLNSLNKEEKPKTITYNVPVQNEEKTNKYEQATLLFLYNMLQHEKVITIYNKESVRLPKAEYRYLASEIEYFYKKYGIISVADFWTYIKDDEKLSATLKKVLNLNYVGTYNKEVIYDYIKVINEYNKNQEIKRLQDRIMNEIDPIKQSKIAEKIRKLRMKGE